MAFKYETDSCIYCRYNSKVITIGSTKICRGCFQKKEIHCVKCGDVVGFTPEDISLVSEDFQESPFIFCATCTKIIDDKLH